MKPAVMMVMFAGIMLKFAKDGEWTAAWLVYGGIGVLAFVDLVLFECRRPPRR